MDSDFDTWSDSDERIYESNPSDFLSVPDDLDGDGVCNIMDFDDDGDGHTDDLDVFPMDPNEWRDDDKDGIGRIQTVLSSHTNNWSNNYNLNIIYSPCF